ncbi:hypothetical protein CDAR_173471 [Caerostris darwini]|uniref:Uncharacterized protein n=1 Tax=Caerostris darwini TaxID=1538125 RepID=A0AAV4WXS8_9ARAC|nr:hypothetical protein CDAR_173471 [Caerostris darwini]
MTTTFTYEEALLRSSPSPLRGLFKTDQPESGEDAARNAQSSVPPKPPRSSVSQVDGAPPTFVASPARCKLLPKDGLSKDDSDEYYIPEGFADDFELLVHQLYAEDLDNLKNPVGGGEKYKIPKCLLRRDSSVEEDLSGQKEDQKKSVAKSDDEFVAVLLRLRKLMNDVQRDFESGSAGTQEVEEVDQQQVEGALDMVERKLHSMESGGAEDGGFESQRLRDYAMRDVELVKNNMRHTVLKLQMRLRDMHQERLKLALHFRNLIEAFDYIINNYSKHIEKWQETIQCIEDPCPLQDRAAFDVYPVHSAQPGAWCSSSEGPSSDPAAGRFNWVHDFMEVALLGVSFYFLFKTYRILRWKA